MRAIEIIEIGGSGLSESWSYLSWPSLAVVQIILAAAPVGLHMARATLV